MTFSELGEELARVELLARPPEAIAWRVALERQALAMLGHEWKWHAYVWFGVGEKASFPSLTSVFP